MGRRSTPTDAPGLVADVGGTHARFALVEPGAATPRQTKSYDCADFPSLQAAARAYLSETATATRPQRVALALATVIDGDTVKMTNSPWTISRTAIAADLQAQEVVLLNDFEALALALPQLQPADVRSIGAATPRPKLPLAVLGPGTGLGVAGCVPTRSGWTALATEGGHATLAAADDFEAEVLQHARQTHAHVSAERLLSGIGLPALHRAVAAARGRRVAEATAVEITQAALDHHDADALATIETFCAMLGGFAGNVALTLGARGGVFLAGGVTARLSDTLARSKFRERFEAKGRFSAYLRPIATVEIITPHAALIGAAQRLVPGRAADEIASS